MAPLPLQFAHRKPDPFADGGTHSLPQPTDRLSLPIVLNARIASGHQSAFGLPDDPSNVRNSLRLCVDLAHGRAPDLSQLMRS